MSTLPVLFRTLDCAGGGAIGVATLNAEATLNALSLNMIALLRIQLQAWEDDPAIALVVLEGAGEKAFCAGGDLQQLYRSMRAHHASAERDDVCANTYALDFFSQEYTLDYQIHTYRKPVLCWGHGIVMGGGIGLLAGASHRVVTEGSRLAMPEVAIGLYPDVGGSWFLNRMPGHVGLFLALTGAPLNASDARFARLADFHLHHGDKAALFEELQRQHWSAQAADNHRQLGVLLTQAQRVAPDDPPGPLRQHFDLIELLCVGADLERIIEHIALLDGGDRWLQKAAAAVRKGSPAAAWLAYTVQQRCKHLSLLEVFKLELGISLRCAARADFVEGIRALIIDKDMQPAWQAASVRELDAVWCEGYFASPWPAQLHPLSHLSPDLQPAALRGHERKAA